MTEAVHRGANKQRLRKQGGRWLCGLVTASGEWAPFPNYVSQRPTAEAAFAAFVEVNSRYGAPPIARARLSPDQPLNDN